MEGMDRGVVSRVRCCREVQKYKDGNACRTQWHGNHRDSGVSQFGGSGEGGGQSRMGYKVTVGAGKWREADCEGRKEDPRVEVHGLLEVLCFVCKERRSFSQCP